MVAPCVKVIFCLYLVVSVLQVLMQWQEFTCSKPIQKWLLTHQLITFCMFLGHEAAHRLPGPGAAHSELLPLHGGRQQRLVSWFVLLIIYPAFLASDGVGLAWIPTVLPSADGCWPDDVVNDPQIVALVLSGGCVWGFNCFFFVARTMCSVLCSCCARRRRRHLDQVLPRGSGPPPRSVSVPRIVVPLEHLLIYCPEATCGQECNVFCTVCQESCVEGQQIRTVVVCGHQFHGACLERWLRNRPVCPNCGQDVATPVEVG